MGEAVLVGGQRLTRVHPEMLCVGEWCCVHNPSPHHMVDWKQDYAPTSKVMRRICPHGIAHPDPDNRAEELYTGIRLHEERGDCDGCCFPPPPEAPQLTMGDEP